MHGIELRLLGGFEASGPDGEPLTVTPKKARALLAYLASHLGKPISRELLSSLIWGDISANEQARRSLRQTLTVLRRELPDGVLSTQRDRIQMDPSTSVDVARFEHDARAAERSALEQALKLYRGELLEDFTARANGFDEWLERERRRLRALAADAMQRLCELQRAQGDAAASMTTAMRLVATDPIREAAHRLLMELYAEAGRGSEAVRQFEALRAVLSEKLGTAPDAQTAELLERIRRSSERRVGAHGSVAHATAPQAPELRQACVLAIAIGEQRFDLSLERDVELILARFGGSLLRASESRALGVFGFPRAHDNDIERGVRAALSLSRLERVVDGISVGVASGPVLVEHRGGKPVLQGDVLGRASALSELEASGVVVAGPIARALGERLEARSVERDAEARRALRYRDAAEVPCLTPLVGRHYELAQLVSALELCAESGRGRTFIVRGEAGIGKTRLLRAFCERATERGFVVHAESLVDFGDDGREPPLFGIIGELLAGAGGPSPSPGLVGDTDVAPLLEMVRPADAPSREPGGRALYLRRRREAACRLLELRSTQRPRLLWVDDVHWADAETLAQIAAWIEVAAGHPLLLVVTTRLEGEPDSDAFRCAVRGRPVTTLDLAPLAQGEARALLQAFEPRDEQTEELLLSRAGGNPLFIEQIARCAHPSRVPASISSMVQARSDQLSAEDRATLQAASTLGQCFTAPALSHLLEIEQPALGGLIAQSLIHEHGDGYRFSHALVRDAVYDGVPRERRVRLHGSAAAYYAGRDPPLHAQHLDCAGHEGACLSYLQAASSERRSGNAERALELCLRGGELAERAGERHGAALLLGELSIDLGRSEAALDAFAAALSAASDARGRAQAHVGRAAALRILDRSKEALLELASAEQLLHPEQDALLLSRIHYLRGSVLFPLGDPAACLDSQTLALEAARRTGSALAEAQAMSGIADAHFMAGRLGVARSWFTRCERTAKEIGCLDLELTSRGMRYVLDMYSLSLRDAAEGCQRTAEASKSSGALRPEALTRVSTAWSFLALGDWDSALAEARRGVTVAEAIGSQRFAALGIAYAAMARAQLGDLRSADADLERALSLTRSSSMGFAGPAVYAAVLATADDARLPALLDEVDEVIYSARLWLALITLVLYAMHASLKLGDPSRTLRYAGAVEASMREERHALGVLIADFGRTLARWQEDPDAESARREVQRLREELEAAHLRLALSFVDEILARAPRARRGLGRARR